VILFLQVTKCGVVEAVLSWARFKAAKDLQKQCSGKKQNKLKGCVLIIVAFRSVFLQLLQLFCQEYGYIYSCLKV
jgi:hypothetical protein